VPSLPVTNCILLTTFPFHLPSIIPNWVSADLFESNINELKLKYNLDLNEKAYCLYIPRNELLKRNNYNYFAYLNNQEVLEANLNISKYLLLAL